ncbi:LOW QUALITY PROTEIN: PH and SEC7 domain-containing protein [Phymastichus coffea]|uniref:LOW QUALITY PROTEIN: PH and SEC7 domain-containing protein n=1 Tax=Phymastichus coffea TaxID=108790 RepID=UPI00273AB6C5|nr:LOW QUALITY PROTEIN: PH and SEC7 domain-containing protein [Phymastichus coffea]
MRAALDCCCPGRCAWVLRDPRRGPCGFEHVKYQRLAQQVEAGDVILRVNEVDVNRLSTKEVLKCLRLSPDPVTLKLRRDPDIKAHVLRLLSPAETIGAQPDKGPAGPPAEAAGVQPAAMAACAQPPAPDRAPSGYASSHSRSNGSCSDASASSDLEALLPAVRGQQHDSFLEEERLQWEPLGTDKFAKHKNPPRFEAYMMTGDLMLNLSRTQQSSGFLPKHQKKVDSLRYNNHHAHHHHHHNHHNNYHRHNSVPTSPNEKLGQRRVAANNHGPDTNFNANSNSAWAARASSRRNPRRRSRRGCADKPASSAGQVGQYASGFVRTSRSEDHLQLQKDPCMSGVEADIDDDVTSSLNTLLDTRAESCGAGLSSERIVWTYNAPVGSAPSAESSLAGSRSSSNCNTSASNSSSSSESSNGDTSPQRSLSPASPTSVSSSVMSSNSGSRRFPPAPAANAHPLAASAQQQQHHHQPHHLLTQQPLHSKPHSTGFLATNGDLSQSEAISNLSSPDYNDEETMDILSARDLMMVSDPSDSDSTILASEPPQRRLKQKQQQDEQHRIVIQVKGPEKHASPRQSRRDSLPGGQQSPTAQPRNNGLAHEYAGYQELRELEDDKEQVDERPPSPPHSADEESDIESLHSFHYSPKAVDLPSAVRLAKRLHSLDGFKKSDVSRHLSKNNDFSRAVAEEYLKYFNFERDTLDVALRKFLAQFSLTGETQERERVLVHFSKRYLDCNPGSFNSQDAVHTLTCAIMLLNTDLHGQNIGRKMSCSEFIENLSELNDGENFPREVLKQLYNAIKSFPLEWALDEEGDEVASQAIQQGDSPVILPGNPFLDVPNVTGATEFKKGYVMRKCCYDSNGKKTPFGKRGWKMYYCTLRELVLYLHKDEHGFRSDSLHNAIRIHHALATKASDYMKKQHVFRLQTADQAEYLFQTSDSKELQSWIDTINFVCASFSSQPLAGAVGSQRKFQRPLLPCTHTKLSPREQLRDHEDRVNKLEAELEEHRRHPPERGAKALTVQNYKEKDAYLHYELKRYKTYAYLLRSRLAYTEIEPSLVESSIGEVDEGSGAFMNVDVALVPPPVPDRPATNRYSYRAAIYNRNLLNGQDYSGDIG